ncbi:hypothetical protein SUGI_1190450 [Cryptomeria japonica]|uniref:brassinosteroid-responsive RING protein 1 n=1 Tax=Cryptomeria japonica TaxID=3369 RepID=UPI0024148B0F|nr:brassinosteroid-responsive RING protein 1 [Cryptomeria japonica]GLJ55442.1 hypothetical protein SUGI_1190450 [Cryptomeria japonica]
MMPILVFPAVPRFFKLGFALDYIYFGICGLLTLLGLHNIHTSETTFPASSASARRIKETLSVLAFRDLTVTEVDDSCAVCLGSFEEDDEIRKLCNCRHIFHRECLDKWTDYYKETCPLCRSDLLPKSERNDDTQADNVEPWS